MTTQSDEPGVFLATCDRCGVSISFQSTAHSETCQNCGTLQPSMRAFIHSTVTDGWWMLSRGDQWLTYCRSCNHDAD